MCRIKWKIIATLEPQGNSAVPAWLKDWGAGEWKRGFPSSTETGLFLFCLEYNDNLSSFVNRERLFWADLQGDWGALRRDYWHTELSLFRDIGAGGPCEFHCVGIHWL